MLINPPSSVEMHSTSSNRFHLKAIVYVLVTIFGLGTWTNLAGIWIELPIVVSILPESWQLPAKLILIIQSANIVPIFIVTISLIFKLNTASFEVPVNFILLLLSIAFAIAFAYLWDKTAYLFDIEQSIYLMILCFFTAIVDCMSSTTFIPFLYRYEPVYLNAYFLGEALTALLPALVGIFQGIGTSDCVLNDNQTNGTWIEVQHEARFSVRTYFLLLSSLPFAALLAFSTLRIMKTGRLKTKTSKKESRHHQSRVFILMDNIGDMNFIQNTMKTIDKIENQLKKPEKKNSFKKFLLSEPVIFLFIVFQCSAMLYGAGQGLTAFSLNAYSATTFHYTIIASKTEKKIIEKVSFFFIQGQFAYPLMTLIGAFIPEVSSKIYYFLYVISTAFFVYIFLTVGIDDKSKKEYLYI